MAKKKSSAKKASVKKSNTKKTSVKKVVKKSAAKKAAPVKKKTVKKAVKKAAPKAAAKKTAMKAKKTPAKTAKSVKATPKVTPKAASKAMKPANQHLVTAAPAKKIVDLSDFVTPLDDRLIVQTFGAEKMTAGGLYIPDTVADVSGNLHGTVVAIGRGHMNKKGHVLTMDVQVGDKVVFSEYAGSKIKIQNEDLIILRESEVMGVVTK